MQKGPISDITNHEQCFRNLCRSIEYSVKMCDEGDLIDENWNKTRKELDKAHAKLPESLKRKYDFLYKITLHFIEGGEYMSKEPN